MAKPVFVNNFSTTLTSGPHVDTDTVFTLLDIGALVTPGSDEELRLTLIDADDPTILEIVLVSSVSGSDVTVVREQEGTTAPASWEIGAIVEARETAAMYNSLPANRADGLNATAVGEFATADGDYALAYGHSANASGNYDVAFGPYSVASGTYSLALGSSADATAQYAIAIGRNTQASAADALAMGRDADASGVSSIAIGDTASADGASGIAIGDEASSQGSNNIAAGKLSDSRSNADIPAWAASTAYSIYDVVSIAGNANQLLICLEGGTSDVSEPSGSDSTTVVDNTATWLIAPSSTTSDDSNVALGFLNRAYGGRNTMIGVGLAAGSSSIALGNSAYAAGERAIALAGKALHRQAIAVGCDVPDYRGIGLGGYIGGIGRTPEECLTLGITSKYMPFDKAYSNQQYPFVDHHDWWYSGGADRYETDQQHTREVTFYSVPIQAGDEGWASSTTYTHGQCVVPSTPNGYSYVAYIFPDDYFTTGDSSGSEPTWPTTPGDSVTDGDIDWLCVDPSDIQFEIPDYTRFTPTSVGVMTRVCSPGGGVVQPSVSFGVDGDLDKWRAATVLTKMTGDGASEFLEPTNTEYAKQFGGAVTTFGTDIDCQIVLVLKGYIMEELTV